MKDNNKFDAIRLIRGGNNCEDSLSADSLNNEYKNIDLRKILGDNMEPDEKVIYVAKSHWSIFVFSLLFFLVAIAGMFYYGNNIPAPLVILFIVSTFGLFLYFNLKVILTDKRIKNVVSLSKKGILLKDIISVSSYINILGSGKLFIEHCKYPNKFLPIISYIKNAKELEIKINEQIKSISFQNIDNQYITTSDKFQKVKMDKYKVPILIFAIICLQSLLIYKGMIALSKITTAIFIGYLIYRNIWKKK